MRKHAEVVEAMATAAAEIARLRGLLDEVGAVLELQDVSCGRRAEYVTAIKRCREITRGVVGKMSGLEAARRLAAIEATTEGEVDE